MKIFSASIIFSLLWVSLTSFAYAATVTLTPTEIAADCSTVIDLDISGLGVDEYLYEFDTNDVWYRGWNVDFFDSDSFSTVLQGCGDRGPYGEWDFAVLDNTGGQVDASDCGTTGAYVDCEAFVTEHHYFTFTEFSSGGGSSGFMNPILEQVAASGSAAVQNAVSDNATPMMLIFGGLVSMGLLIRVWHRLVGPPV